MDGPELGREAGGGLQVVPVHRPAVADRVGDGFPLIKRVIRVTIHQYHPHLLQHCAQSLLVPHVRFELWAVAAVVAVQQLVAEGVLVQRKVEPLVLVHRGVVPAQRIKLVPRALALQHAARHDVHGPVRPVGHLRQPLLQIRHLLQLGHRVAGGRAVRVDGVRPAHLRGPHHKGVGVVRPGRPQRAVLVDRQVGQQGVGRVDVLHRGHGQVRPAAVRNVVVAVRGPKVVCGEHVAFVEVQVAAAELGQVLEVLDVVPVGHGEFGINRLQALLKKNGER
mmetsp:Transcript_10559/g.17673  ORF Transcript_10559/g.17673 Transcript_10559/m.17673 type:complete len:278 (+) Transcript_10559:532-1365(+)